MEVNIVMRGGMVDRVEGVPDGWGYVVQDHDLGLKYTESPVPRGQYVTVMVRNGVVEGVEGLPPTHHWKMVERGKIVRVR